MASPQKENGYTQLSNELLEAVVGCYLSSYEKDVILAIIRKTYGWGKTKDWVAASQLSDMTGIPRPHITRTVKKLVSKKIVTQTGNSIGIQKDYDQWIVKWRKLPKQVTGVTQTGNRKLPKQVHTKERKKLSKEKSDKSLPVSKKTMTWKKPYNEDNPTDYTPSIDLDTGEPTKQPVKQKRMFKEVYKVFEETLGKYPANWIVNTTQQKCADNLYTERGLKAIRNALEFYKTHKDEEFCPQVTQPSDLDAKWTKLATFKNKGHES